ncbi:T9SS C-terminal target domain-containing protein [Putridiphycobacter roseus]|uniref:T9SS C-terminal target domain-containing protein n=1 Tax=Putridiphycobacter roseus TaxID=2219161 RepID=A0A2W1N6R9_9FLAO|nr:T9SS type A sorting domain-containing protein [Putridiphycobacter roseus]PZE18851.1 T9SS C-terminal target domain-containing protein [Putridiphycobacter roseus]
MKNKLLSILVILITSNHLIGQTTPFHIHIEPMTINGLGGLQAFAYGQHDGKWLIVGGRLDGLHRRQPWAAFDVAGNNNQIIVVDPVAKQTWNAPLSSLSTDLQEQLSATNMEFHQNGDYLYVIGGYGYNAATTEKKTFDKLTAIHVPNVIHAIINSTPFTSEIRQITDSEFAVTGGHLSKINNTYYLVGGNQFDGDYNPIGNPTYTQVYTNTIRKFNMDDDGTNLTITHLPSITDAANLHRRDLNVVHQILPSGEEGITAFSGVFQPTVNLPFLTAVTIDSINHAVDNNFLQYYNHYHCAVLPLYSVSNNAMHTVFFGGIAQYYDNNGTLVQDNEVPFVKTIARVTRDQNGVLAEYKLPIEMPNYLGAGSEFIPIQSLSKYPNEVFKLDDFSQDSTLVGYIFGGISSTQKNIFFINTGSESSASDQIFKVYVLTDSTLEIDNLNEQSIGTLNLEVFPNPNRGDFIVHFNLVEQTEVKFSLYTLDGKKLEEKVLTDLKVGKNTFERKFRSITKGGIFLLTIETATETVTRKIVIQ